MKTKMIKAACFSQTGKADREPKAGMACEPVTGYMGQAQLKDNGGRRFG